MQVPVDNDVFQFAKLIAAEAANLTLDWFQSHDLKIDIKADNTEVTDADKAVEEYLRTAMKAKSFLMTRLLAKNQKIFSGKTSRQWIIDPIDGTASFARGVPLFSSLLAMFDESGPAVGIIHLPALNEFIAAGRGIGVSSSQPNTTVSSVEHISSSCISSSSFDVPWWPEKPLNIAASGAKTRTWGDGYGYFLVATGRIEAMIDPPLYTYDVAPMLTIIPESGGRISSWDGKTELEDKIGWVATNGLIHEDLLTLLNS